MSGLFKLYEINLKIVKLEPQNFHLFAKGKWNKIPINIIVDTGASHTCFDYDFYKKLKPENEIIENEGINVGIGTDGFKTQLAPMHSLKIGRFNVHDFQVNLLSLEHINNVYKTLKIPSVQCILGSDFFVSYNAIISYLDHKMTIFS